MAGCQSVLGQTGPQGKLLNFLNLKGFEPSTS